MSDVDRYPVIDGDHGDMPDDGTCIVVDMDDGVAYLWNDWAYHGTIEINDTGDARTLVGGIVRLRESNERD